MEKRQIPTIRQNVLIWQKDSNSERTTIPVGSEAWFAWLARASLFIVDDRPRRFTVRQKTTQAGSVHWYAVCRTHGKFRRIGLGTTIDLTAQRLHRAAQSLSGTHAVITKAKRQHQPMPDEHEAMILSTKLTIPVSRPNHIERPNALNRLRLAVDYPLTLLSAPAGYGKTTLLAQWATATPSLAWVTLDREDAVVARFWSHILAALDPLIPGLLSLMQPKVRSHDLHLEPDELAALINLLTTAPDPTILVLDDYDTIGHDGGEIQDTLLFIVEHLPANAHIVLASRSDPPMSLARLRARKQLNEIDVTDLRFSREEAAHFLTQTMGKAIAASDIATLYTHIEGWIIGWQLAALTLQGREDITALAESFSGQNHYIIEYLTAEVLNHLPSEQLQFLLQTAILQRFSASLCDAVMATTGSEGMIDALEHAKLFITALDIEHHWYRYHPIFADALHAILRQRSPERISLLYHRASVWCAQQGYIGEAVEYAFHEDDLVNVIYIIEDAITDIMELEGSTMLRQWLQRIPEATIRSHPRLSLAQAYITLFAGEVNAFERWVSGIEGTLGAQSQPVKLPAFEQEVIALSATVAALHGHQIQCRALCHGAQGALSHMPIAAFPVMLSLGMTYWLNGDVQAATQQLEDVRRQSMRQNNQFYFYNSVALLARIYTQQGRLRLALEVCESARNQPMDINISSKEISAIGLIQGMALWLRNESDQAVMLLEQNVEHITSLFLQTESYCVLAGIYQAQGNSLHAKRFIAQALALTQAEPLLTALINTNQAWLWLQQGDIAAAADWARQYRRSVDEYGHTTTLYIREWQELVLARVYLAQQRYADALALLDALYSASSADGRLGRTLDVLVLQAVAHHARGDRQRAFAALRQALEMAQPEGNVRPLMEGGKEVHQMLTEIVTAPGRIADMRLTDSTIAFIYTILRQNAHLDDKRSAHANMSAYILPQTSSYLVVSDLSNREKEILQLLANGVSNQDLARTLVIELGTVKRHLSNIYTKLGVQSRSQAIARAHALHLIESEHSPS